MSLITKKKQLLFLTILLFFIYLKEIFHDFSISHPLISIIIQVSNDINITESCIKSIINAEPSVNYEIIIINDLLRRATFLIEKSFKNYSNIIIHSGKNDNYLLNSNYGAKLSNGKYLVFIRNVLNVHKFWLSSLIKLIESNDNIGMVGSKIITQKGFIKEAGGIVWSNGECYDFGNGSDSNDPEYNYVKEVDYLSGDSIMIRKSIWNLIGGFDPRFNPMYYEDTDFAFEIRKLGYKVMFQPKSVVESSEKIFDQKKLLPNIKEINKKKFIKKWEKELNHQIEQGDTFLARDRGFNKRKIFVIDRFVPIFDRDAGGRCSFMYLNIFCELGLKVTFLGDNLKNMEPYTSILQQKGIEVLYGDNYQKKHLERWLKLNLKYFEYIYLQRPEIAIKYIDIIKNYSHGKIFYFAHDLHYNRLYREYIITKDTRKYLFSKYMERLENKIFSKVNVIHVVGNYEYKILKEKYPNKNITNIPLYVYENQYENIEKNFTKRKGLLFVGGFSHSPNYDGIFWFSKRIYPKIIEKYPDIILYIISSNIPQNIKNLESKNIKIMGHLSDNNLHLFYQKCRIAIAPLRFGAGVKGKVIEAAYNQIPMITTTIGGEGIDNSTGAFIVEDNPDKFAQIIINLYINHIKLKQMSDSGKILINSYFSKNKAKEIISKDLG